MIHWLSNPETIQAEPKVKGNVGLTALCTLLTARRAVAPVAR